MPHAIPHALIEEWNKALEEEVPKRSNLHTRNRALFLLWEDASHNRKEDAENLKTLLSHRYRFEVEVLYIPLEDPEETIRRRILIINNGSDDDSCLVLIYYSGNGSVKQGRPVWLPDSKFQPEIDWFSLQECLETSPSDIVLLFDCGCRTGSSRDLKGDVWSSLHPVTSAPAGRMEILATPSNMSVDDAAFRKALIKTLKGISGESVRIDQVRRKIYRILGEPFDPQYAILSRGNDRSSIAMLPSEKVNLDLTMNSRLNPRNQQGLKTWADGAPWQIKSFQFLELEEKNVDDGQQRISVVVDVARQSDLSEKNISSWIKRAPPYVVGIDKPGSRLSSKDKTGDEHLIAIIQAWNQSSEFRKDLTTRDGQYKKIVVLPIKWEHDGFSDSSMIPDELCDLCGVFEKCFDHCEIKPLFEIPSGGETQALVTEKILEVKKVLKSSNLLIVLYNGHGNRAIQPSRECILSGEGDNAQVDWNCVQPLLYEAPCDVAQILDCCYAGNAIKTGPQGRNEILAACERDENSDSITLRPRSLVVDPGERENAFQRGNEFLGWAYAKVPICRGDERRDWKDVGFVKILTVKETVNELQADSQSSIG